MPAIAIDGSRAFLRRRTGIEEYAYQVIRHLRGPLRDEPVTLYLRSDQAPDFDLPPAWKVKKLWAPRLWTQGRLSLAMLSDRPDILFVPAHTVPLIHPRRTVVTVHGLEYEVVPQGYGFWERLYMRWSIRHSVRAASTVVAVSENTKQDLVRLYGVPEAKIRVIYEGYDEKNSNFQFPISNGQPPTAVARSGGEGNVTPYFLFIGRLEERKNVVRIIEAFELLKAAQGLPHRLILAGKPGHGYAAIRSRIRHSKFKDSIEEPGYVSETEKRELLQGAEAFLFPTLYEGFGLPVLEAQAAGTPVIISSCSSLPEVAGEGAVMVLPEEPYLIAEALHLVLTDGEKRAALVRAGRENLSRFSWERCAAELARILQA